MKEKILNGNYRKVTKIFIVVLIIYLIVSGVLIGTVIRPEITSAKTSLTDTTTEATESTLTEDSKQSTTISGHDAKIYYGTIERGHRGHRSIEQQMIISELSTGVKASMIGIVVVGILLGLFFWGIVIAWLYKSAIMAGMNKSLWPILGIFFNLFAVAAFLIVRDNPKRKTEEAN